MILFQEHQENNVGKDKNIRLTMNLALRKTTQNGGIYCVQPVFGLIQDSQQ